MVEMNPNYLQARDIALAANAVEGANACVGDGECCRDDAPIYPDDIALIEQGLSDGTISRATALNAIARSNDPSQIGRCPFLTDNNRCSIYEKRPYVCVSWGIGGEPIEPGTYKRLASDWQNINESEVEVPKDYQAAANDWKENGNSSPVPNLCLRQATCLDYRFQTAWESTPIEANETMRAANKIWDGTIKAVRNKEKTLLTFARNDLPRIIGEVSLLPEAQQGMSRQQRRQMERENKKKFR